MSEPYASVTAVKTTIPYEPFGDSQKLLPIRFGQIMQHSPLLDEASQA